MRPSDPTAVANRFAAVLARGVARADREIAEHFARIRALPMENESVEPPPWIIEPPSTGAHKVSLDNGLQANTQRRASRSEARLRPSRRTKRK
jgi:hypothetical protein